MILATPLDGLLLVQAQHLIEGAHAALVATNHGPRLTDRANSDHWVTVTDVRIVAEERVRIEGVLHDDRLFSQIVDTDFPVIARDPETES